MNGTNANRERWHVRRARLAATVFLLRLFAFAPFRPTGAGIAEAVTAWDGTTLTEPSQDGGVYLITEAAELAWIGGANGVLDGSYKLSADIDLGGHEWTPSLDFDGSRRTVYGLSITGARLKFAGLFGSTTSSAEIRNLHISGCQLNVSLTAPDANGGIGALVDYNMGTIDGCSASGSIHAIGESATNSRLLHVGLLAGVNAAEISNSSTAGSVVQSAATGDVQAICTTNHEITGGGLIGHNTGKLAWGSASGNVLVEGGDGSNGGNIYAGGLVGFHSNTSSNRSQALNSHATGSVTVRANGANYTRAGGLFGNSPNGDAHWCSSSGAVSVTGSSFASYAGGRAGSHASNSTIPKCYTYSNSVTGITSAMGFNGALAGGNSGIFSNSAYRDGLGLPAIGAGATTNSTEITTAGMRNRSSFTADPPN